MWRALFLAMGISTCIIGAECLVVESFVMGAESKPTTTSQQSLFNAEVAKPPREMRPPEWAPWSLLSTGAIVVLYALAVRRE